MSRAKRLGKLEELRAQAERAKRLPAIHIHLTGGARTEPSAPAWPGSAAEPAPSVPPAPRGQRPRPPSPEEQAEALETLRQRAKVGKYAAYVPPSEAELRAEQERRGLLWADATEIKGSGRSYWSPSPRRGNGRG